MPRALLSTRHLTSQSREIDAISEPMASTLSHAFVCVARKALETTPSLNDNKEHWVRGACSAGSRPKLVQRCSCCCCLAEAVRAVKRVVAAADHPVSSQLQRAEEDQFSILWGAASNRCGSSRFPVRHRGIAPPFVAPRCACPFQISQNLIL